LEQVLDIADLLPGDFIRWAKQVIDALDQIAQNTEGKLSETAKNAIDQVKRGIVAYSFYG
jgi:ATP-dependent RNA helicase HelY